jgi:hypothetical protein
VEILGVLVTLTGVVLDLRWTLHHHIKGEAEEANKAIDTVGPNVDRLLEKLTALTREVQERTKR